MLTRSVLAVFVCIGLSACVPPPPPLNTPSGRPEMTLSNVDTECVKNLLLNTLVDDGYEIESITDNQIIVSRYSQSPTRRALYGTDMYPIPKDRLVAIFIPQPNNRLRMVV